MKHNTKLFVAYILGLLSLLHIVNRNSVYEHLKFDIPKTDFEIKSNKLEADIDANIKDIETKLETETNKLELGKLSSSKTQLDSQKVSLDGAKNMDDLGKIETDLKSATADIKTSTADSIAVNTKAVDDVETKLDTVDGAKQLADIEMKVKIKEGEAKLKEFETSKSKGILRFMKENKKFTAYSALSLVIISILSAMMIKNGGNFQKAVNDLSRGVGKTAGAAAGGALGGAVEGGAGAADEIGKVLDDTLGDTGFGKFFKDIFGFVGDFGYYILYVILGIAALYVLSMLFALFK
jgi:hypothetical protein